MLDEEQKLEHIDLDEKISATLGKHSTHRVAVRKFLAESCSLAKMLPPQKKMIFLMHYSHGYSLTEIAELCNVGPTVVTKRLQQITDELNVMRNCLKETEDGQTEKSTKERIEAYFRRERKGRDSLRKRKNSRKNL